MNEPTCPPEIGPDLLVSQVLERWPQTIPVFIKHRMNCVGCEMSVFEVISEAARIYHLDGTQFLDELNQVAARTP